MVDSVLPDKAIHPTGQGYSNVYQDLPSSVYQDLYQDLY